MTQKIPCPAEAWPTWGLSTGDSGQVALAGIIQQCLVSGNQREPVFPGRCGHYAIGGITVKLTRKKRGIEQDLWAQITKVHSRQIAKLLKPTLW